MGEREKLGNTALFRLMVALVDCRDRFVTHADLLEQMGGDALDISWPQGDQETASGEAHRNERGRCGGMYSEPARALRAHLPALGDDTEM